MMPYSPEELKNAILEGEDDLALDLVRKALDQGAEPLDLVNRAIVPGIQEAGELWKKNRYFQSDVIMSAEAFRIAMEVVEPLIGTGQTGNTRKVVIGTVAGDMHNLGKIIVIAMLRGAGFDVIDLGEDVPTSGFIDAVKAFKPDILGLGCYMTTTMLEMTEVVRKLNECELRDHVKVLIGGVPISQEFADEIGADAWGRDALDAVDRAKQLTEVE
jgi:5-methyltetrahydrofolate--homocysteine methyltransferase